MRAADEWVDAPHLVSLPGVGHLPHEESPEAVTAAILAWLQPSAVPLLRRPLRRSLRMVRAARARPARRRSGRHDRAAAIVPTGPGRTGGRAPPPRSRSAGPPAGPRGNRPAGRAAACTGRDAARSGRRPGRPSPAAPRARAGGRAGSAARPRRSAARPVRPDPRRRCAVARTPGRRTQRARRRSRVPSAGDGPQPPRPARCSSPAPRRDRRRDSTRCERVAAAASAVCSAVCTPEEDSGSMAKAASPTRMVSEVTTSPKR